MSNWLEEMTHAFARSPEQPRPYRSAAVSFRTSRASDYAARRALVEQTGLNVFLFPAREIPGCDLLTDSGTTTMTMEQWSQLLLGDESYGSNEGYFEFKDQVAATFGPGWVDYADPDETVFIFHQGRSAEHALFTVLARILPPRSTDTPYIIPSNGHFDTTQANIEDNGFEARNLFSKAALADDETERFKGSIDVEALAALLADPLTRARVPLVYLTVTNNTGGGQPVSLANIRAAHRLTAAHGIPLLFDACRFAENAWFIKHYEEGCASRSVAEIVREMFAEVDAFHISLKKDGLVHIGGALIMRGSGLLTERYPTLRTLVTSHQILTEGHPTYGGLAGRDLKGAVAGLRTVLREEYLDHRIRQVVRFGTRINELVGRNVVVLPVGGHAVYLDVDRFFAGTRLTDRDLPGISLTALLLVAGHRLCELGIYAFGRFKDGQEIPPDPRVNKVRAAVPRLTYEDQDLFALAESIRCLYQARDEIRGVDVVYGRDLPLRHFKSRFRFRT